MNGPYALSPLVGTGLKPVRRSGFAIEPGARGQSTRRACSGEGCRSPFALSLSKGQFRQRILSPSKDERSAAGVAAGLSPADAAASNCRPCPERPSVCPYVVPTRSPRSGDSSPFDLSPQPPTLAVAHCAPRTFNSTHSRHDPVPCPAFGAQSNVLARAPGTKSPRNANLFAISINRSYPNGGFNQTGSRSPSTGSG